MNRFDRIIAIFIQLQSRKVVRSQDIADRFKISLRTVYRDIRSLEEAGVPIIGEAGVGYSIVDGYRLPPVMFTQEEAMTFVTAEKLMEKFTDISTKASYQSAMFKVKSVLRKVEKDALERIEKNIAVISPTNDRRKPHNENSLAELIKSISEKKAVCITYGAVNADEPSTRTIEPVGVFNQHNYWYTIAFCHLRNDYRNFRTDRIFEIKITDKPFHKEHSSLDDYLKQTSETRNLETVVMSVNKRIVGYMREERYYHGFVSEKSKGNQVEMTFLSASLEGFSRWFLMLAGDAEILSPESLQEMVKSRLRFLSEKFNIS